MGAGRFARGSGVGSAGGAFGADLRYTLLRLRTNDRSAAAQALTDAEIEATGILADELTDRLGSA